MKMNTPARTVMAKALPVRIVINDPAGKRFTDFEIPQAAYAAMRRDAQAKGISLVNWMADAVRAQVEPPAPASPPLRPEPGAADDEISLLFFSQNAGTSLAHVDVTPAQWAAVQRHARQSGRTVEQCLKHGLFWMVAADGPTNQQLFDLRGLEQNLGAAHSLMMVLAEKTEDRGLMRLAENMVVKLMADFAAFSQSVNPGASENELAA